MRTGVSAPRTLVLICVRTICFAETGLVGSGGVSGMRQVACHPFAVSRNQFPAANQQVWDQKLAMKAKREGRIFCYLCYSKIIAKGEVVGL